MNLDLGKFGKIVDHFLLCPLIGWATAISFVVLKRWSENIYRVESIQKLRCWCFLTVGKVTFMLPLEEQFM